MQYGLKASLIEISEDFDGLLMERRIEKDRIYTRMIFIESNEQILVDKGLKTSKQEHIQDCKGLLTPESDCPVITARHDGPMTRITVSIPYFFKSKYAGQIVAWISPHTIYPFVEVSNKLSNRSVYIVYIKHHILLQGEMKKGDLPLGLPDFDNSTIGKIHQFEAVDKDGDKMNMVALPVHIKNTPFALITVLPTCEIFGHITPWHLPIAMGLLAIILLAGTAVAFRINTQNRLLQVRLDESTKKKREIEEKRRELEKEISARKLVEEELRKAREKLEIRVKERTVELARANEELQREIIERKRAGEELRKSEGRFRDISYSIADWIWEVDNNGRYTFASGKVKEILGYNPEELIDRNPLDLMPEDEAKHIGEIVKRIISEKKPMVDLENWNLSKEGDLVCLLTNGTPIFDESGELIGYRGVDKDITDDKRAEKEQKKLEAQLQRAEKMESLGTLAGGVAHDLNNILSGIVSYPDLLLMQLPEESPLRKPIETIKGTGVKAAAIVQDLLTLARRGVATTEIVNLNMIISEYLSSLEYAKLKSFHPEVQVKTDFDTDLLNIMGSPVHLSKTIMNLVSNAAEAMPSGGKIIISTENRYIDRPVRGYDDVKEGDYVALAVYDTGLGISSEDKERIFEPFYTKKVMGRSGTGLGMAVIWGTVKDHKGYIDIQSKKEKGTTFTLYFPVTREELAENRPELSIEDYMGNGESILVVDDVKEQREIAAMIFSQLGYKVAIVSSGEEAVEYVKSHKTDLVILDMVMDPGIDGLDTYRRIIDLYPGQKAIITSGFSETERVKETQRLGAGQYVKKPYTLGKLAAAVKNSLDK